GRAQADHPALRHDAEAGEGGAVHRALRNDAEAADRDAAQLAVCDHAAEPDADAVQCGGLGSDDAHGQPAHLEVRIPAGAPERDVHAVHALDADVAPVQAQTVPGPRVADRDAGVGSADVERLCV